MFNKYLQVLPMITLTKPYISVVVSLSCVWSHLILMPLIFAVIVKTKFSVFETLNSSSMIQFSNCLLKVKWYHLSLHHPINIFIVQPSYKFIYSPMGTSLVAYLAGKLYWHLTTTDFVFEIHSVHFCLGD